MCNLRRTTVSIIFAAVFTAGCGGSARDNPHSSIIPGTLLIYYGYPSLINGSTSTSQASEVFRKYDYAVLGAGLEDIAHGDHLNMVQIVNDPLNASTYFFGYVDCGVSTSNFTEAVMKSKIDSWKGSGVQGIFLDDFGYDYGVDRSRQNAVVDYAHAEGLSVTANAWTPSDVFGSAAVAVYNPSGTPSRLGPDDFYLSESYQISDGAYQAESDWYSKSEALASYRSLIGFRILSVTTASSSDIYSRSQFFYAWYSALLFEHTAVGWGEYEFSADDNSAVFRDRPSDVYGAAYAGAVVDSSPEYSRTADSGIIWINVQTRQYGIRK